MAAVAPGTVVSARDLTVRYPASGPGSRNIAVNGVTLAVAEGEILAIVGEAGSGKSTLAETIAGVAGRESPSSPQISGGQLRVLDTEVRGMSGRQRDRLTLRVGYLPQDAGTGLAPRLTIGENVAEPIFSRDRHFDQWEAGEAVATLVDAVRLPLSAMNKYPHELSKGQRQRAAIARALILEPALLVADDPTTGIDVTVRSAILDVIRDLQEVRSFSAIVVTADIAEVRRIACRLAVMHRGCLVGLGSVDEVLGDPTHPYVSGLARILREESSTMEPRESRVR